jgi:hypothetical protein
MKRLAGFRRIMLGSRDVSHNNRELLDHLSNALASNVSRRIFNDKVDVYFVWNRNTASKTKLTNILLSAAG